MSAKENFDALLSHLTEDQVEALSLRYEADLTVAEIARLMERTPSSIRVLLHRGREHLKRILELDEEEARARSKLKLPQTHDPVEPYPRPTNVIPFPLRRSM